jgi:N-acetyl sugar amidotransferase
VRYCTRCVLPDTRPGLSIGPDGVCSACAAHEEKKNGVVDWPARRARLDRLIKDSKRPTGYDCIVPVSGGKDSTWQAIKCLEYGLRVLAVTWKTPARTEIGQRNLDNLVRLGVDHIDYTINPEVERRFMLEALTRVGDSGLPMHMALYAVPLRLAVAMNVPLVVWGESPHMEYGGSAEDRQRDRLDSEWLARHGILQGTSVDDWIGDGLSAKDLDAYRLPDASELEARSIRSIFLGYYLPWDPEESLRAARAHGFAARAEGPKVGYYDYADIDCDFISVHHYFKWLKFGFTRLFDNLAIEIRNERMTRAEAVRVIAARGDDVPRDDIARLCRFLRISEDRFWEIGETFRNPAVWVRTNGVWTIPGFLVPDWPWAGVAVGR